MWNEKLKRLGENEKKQTITISIAAGNYDNEIIIDLINQAIQDFWVKYQESSVGFETLPIFSPLKISVSSRRLGRSRLFRSRKGRSWDFHIIYRVSQKKGINKNFNSELFSTLIHSF